MLLAYLVMFKIEFIKMQTFEDYFLGTRDPEKNENQ